jgi:hypothetical protein
VPFSIETGKDTKGLVKCQIKSELLQLMREAGLRAKGRRKYKATTDSMVSIVSARAVACASWFCGSSTGIIDPMYTGDRMRAPARRCGAHFEVTHGPTP